MSDDSNTGQDRKRPEPYRVRLPGFTAGQEAGLGDVLKRATGAIGIQPCGGCERRAAVLNRWLVFTREAGRPNSF